MALAHGGTHFTLPHAVQEFRMSLGFMPALWADDGDFVLVDDVLFAVKALAQCRKPHAEVVFVSKHDLRQLDLTCIDPWGWDRAVRQTLLDAGVGASVLPSDEYLACIRGLSDRRRTSDALEFIRTGLEGVTCGECLFCASSAEVEAALRRFGKIVVKAPWSSSGRGVKYVDGGFSVPMAGWIANTIARQGGVMVEPYYKKVKDFALEFYSDGSGNIEYCGASVFKTDKSSYSGNLIAAEEEKLSALSEFLPASLLFDVIQKFKDYFSEGSFQRYTGPLGVDMMVVTNDGGRGFLLHPCVEINVRRTMGHVANVFKPALTDPVQFMHIVHDVNYRLKFDNLENNFVKVI